jgi:D-glycero-D-manno-heptose 1,7-bisphosphate phosphatase
MDNKITVFIDRDGVINFDSPDYIKSCEELVFIPGSIEAIADLSRLGHKIFIITNQSVIGRKMVTEKGLQQIFAKMEKAVEDKGGKIDDIFFCPHTPQDNCDCRKPLPGLFFQAKNKYKTELKNSVMIGDSAKDIKAAEAACTGYRILVLTGNGEKALKELSQASADFDYTARNLEDAAEWIKKNTGMQ